MKFRYPIGLFITAMIIGAISDSLLPTKSADPIQGICALAIMISIPWGFYIVIRKTLKGFKSFLFELIDKVKE